MANYTPEETEKLLDLYKIYGSNRLDEIALLMNKNVRSIRAKLSREKKYTPPDKDTNKASDGPRKKELIQRLSALTGRTLEGIDPATKGALQELIEAFEEILETKKAA